ncbi:hypothetical protein OLM90_17150 [Pseudomonas aeruginosa]|uniref:hypothetical protein n=1 Tax=Pseudomonas aeruginosa TaxID=287 RepID=UPI000B4B6D17|nr:hypothetical protein [Pseudomonas aeruginosa]EKV5213715.1 hypothetical protein [Pseudomonas aeruginosa]ELN9487149.1 hypothetical protein [Pseudomonas aeruginosa]ELX9570311.1 hypothetical protein [Pseudomonas aeruginosa]EME0469161.1 hypothetical protein [Pseudomonas aeruginosa]MCK1051471.1 hypothetical protein [Pseudomonas aeruginosa]
MEQAMREEFEKEYDWPSLDERQRLIVGGSCWSVWQKAWQASRAALRVELPERRDPLNSTGDDENPRSSGFNACLERVKEALQQAGIEVAE